MNTSDIVFPSEDPFNVISVDNQLNELRIYVQSKQKVGICPNCSLPSKKLHSYYTRQVNDLPVFGKVSRIFLRSRKYYCKTLECPYKVFSERFEMHFKPYKRRTERLELKVRELGLLVGGKPAERVSRLFSIPVSDSTILRMVQGAEIPQEEQPSAVGVDDWAFKKRDRYGSVLVNLNTGKIIDLLPDREEKTLRDWLRERPGIEVVTRDRYSNYQKAITVGAPQAIQITDRWHLLKNLGEAVQKVLVREYSRINKALHQQHNEVRNEKHFNLPVISQDIWPSSKSAEGIRSHRFKQLKQLQNKGYSISVYNGSQGATCFGV